MKRYAKDHEWICIDAEDVASVGISQYAVASLGEITSIKLPEVDSVYEKGTSFAIVESTEASSEIFMPASGKIVAVNEQLEDFPQLLNSDAENIGWIIKIIPTNPCDINELMSAKDYQELVEKKSEEIEEE